MYCTEISIFKACRTREKLAELSASKGGQLSCAFSLHMSGKLLNNNIIDRRLHFRFHCRQFDQSDAKKLWVAIVIG
jgi:hypothetical protein